MYQQQGQRYDQKEKKNTRRLYNKSSFIPRDDNTISEREAGKKHWSFIVVECHLVTQRVEAGNAWRG